MKKIICLFIFVLVFSGCSVLLAGSKSTKPVEKEDIVEIKTRSEFEEKVSKNIIKEEAIGSEKLVVYSKWYDSGAKIRMVMHLGLDVVTLGLWELVGFIGEVNTNPTAFYDLEVLYNDRDEIIGAEVIES